MGFRCHPSRGAWRAASGERPSASPRKPVVDYHLRCTVRWPPGPCRPSSAGLPLPPGGRALSPVLRQGLMGLATDEAEWRRKSDHQPGVGRNTFGRSRDPASGACRPAPVRVRRSGSRRRPGGGHFPSANSAPSRGGRRASPLLGGARRNGFRAHRGSRRNSHRPETMLAPRPTPPSTQRGHRRDRPRAAPLEMAHQTRGLRPTRRAGQTCRRRFSRASAASPIRSGLRTWPSHRVEQSVDGLSESQAPVDPIDGVGRTSALSEHGFAAAQDEVDLCARGEPQLLADLDGHRDLAL